MSNVYVQSMLDQRVIEISGGHANFTAVTGATLDADNAGVSFLSPPSATVLVQEAGYQLWNFVSVSDRDPKTFYIESGLGTGLVIDLESAIDTQSDRGPELVLRKQTGATSQQWKISAPEANDYYFIQSASNPDYVIDIRQEEPEPGTVQLFRQKKKNAENQLWRQVQPYVNILLHAPPSLIGPSVIYFAGGRVQFSPGNDGAKGTTVVGNPFGLSNYPGGLGKPT